MELWHAWLNLLQHLLQTLAVNSGLGTGLAIILLTLAVRGMLVPLTWPLAYRGAMRQAKLKELAPAVKSIRERHAADPRAQMQAISELYRAHGLSLADGKSLLGAVLQMPVIYGLYRALSTAGSDGFLWVRSLARPDAGLAILAALTTVLVMAVAPNLTESTRFAMLLVPAVLCLAIALHLSSGIALYWITSNFVSAAQTFALRQALRRSGIR